MNSEEIIKKARETELLKTYEGPDKVVKVSELWKQIEADRMTRPEFSALTGIQSIDDCLKKLKRGHLIVLSGPPKNGKTSLAMTFTKSFVEQGLKCLWFPFEMGHEDILDNFKDLFSDTFDFYSPQELIDKELEWVRSKIIEAKLKYGADAVFIDHTDFLRDRKLLSKNLSMNTATYVGAIIQGVKVLALEQNVIIVLLHHLTKANWTTNELPTAEDMRDTGQVAQLADYVLMIIRKRASKGSENIYIENEAVGGVIENRHGGLTKKFLLYMENGFFYEGQRSQEIEVKKEQLKW